MSEPTPGSDESAAGRGSYSQSVFGPKSGDYAAARPGYPPEVFARLVECGLLGPARVVADIGSGTGLFSRDLLAHCAVLYAVEPNAAMRQAAEALLGAAVGFRSVDGSAEVTTLPVASVDLVTAAQAFHWFEPEGARREFRRILRPGGGVVFAWNMRLLTDPLQAALEEVFDEFGGDARAVVQAAEDRGHIEDWFGVAPYEVWEIAHEQVVTAYGLLALVLSRSYMPPRETPAGEEVARRIGGIFERHAQEGRVVVRYTTAVHVGSPFA